MINMEKVIKGLKCCDISNVEKLTCFNCPYVKINRADGMAVCTARLTHDALELLKEQENCVSIPFTWLVKFCTHLDFHEPMSDEERAERWKEKLSQQLGVKWDEAD